LTQGEIGLTIIIAQRLAGLSDVYGTPSDGDVPIWNAANDRFEFGAP
jgi:hypothetical protein